MDKLIADFSIHLREALEIGNKTPFAVDKKQYNNILICGLGGSGIGGTIASQVLKNQCKLPLIVNKDYQIPAFVDKNTLVIACSYSGNTEETLSMLETATSAGAEICIITSGGKLAEIAQSKNLNFIIIPGDFPPRAAFGYSFPQILFALEKYGIIRNDFIEDLKSTVAFLESEENTIRNIAKEVANKLFNKIPVIYSEPRFEGVCMRFRQQINENSKMLCWHHTIPEMNHNELVGWKEKNEDLVAVFLWAENDFFRNKERMKYSQNIMEKNSSGIIKIEALGDSHLKQCIYLVHLTDWISFYLADKKGIDPVEVNVITGLKNMLADIGEE